MKRPEPAPLALLRNFWAAPIVGGALLALSFPPLDWGLLAIPGWALLFVSMRLRRGERAGRQALLFGLVFYTPGLAWIAPLVSVGWLFTAFWCACWEALFAWTVAKLWLRPEGTHGAWYVGAPLLHLLVDMGRTVFMTGFPWLLTGYSAWKNPVLLGSADLLGVHGATLAILAGGAGLAEVAARRLEGRSRGVAALVPAVVLWAVFGLWAALKPEPVVRPGPTVALLQANIPQYLKEDRKAQGLERTSLEEWWTRHADLALAARNAARKSGRALDVVVWPETMVPAIAHRRLEQNPELFRKLAGISGGAHTLAGIVTQDSFGRRWNTVVLLDPDGLPIGSQDKQHLTPGGEYLPLFDWLPFRAEIEAVLREKAGFLPNLEPGESTHLLAIQGPAGPSRAGILICYESIFPSISRSMVRDGAAFLVNASNYGWFVGTGEMDQALAMGCFRAAETRRALVMSSNNGVSAVIGPDGVPTAYAENEAGERVDVPGFCLAQVPLSSGSSPFLWWGEWAAWGLGLAGLVLGLLYRRSPDRPKL